ncbi:cytochrome c oxidase assembly protein [Glycomyces terrestris]|uniref:Cytochrome c oxidase assembly protein n=1 Tax=Glycomyces terrestris TaxID=2493553 RepID=A0A426UWB3_9ACTN|nr:cytochrome c oxidase assembly protein [Glycomyces terrestris]RRR98481.1 cytochrome c oxidase assembly protein [Glycomyces terrestris]
MSGAVLHHPPLGPTVLVVSGAAFAAILVYLWGADRLRRRGDAWPLGRDLAWTAGAGSIAITLLMPLPGGPFTAHAAQHLVLGMAAPLLLVLARPLTLAFRALGPGRTRRALLSSVHSRPIGWLAFAPLAALADLGGLWVLYRTPLFAAVQDRPLAHAAVQAHVIGAGVWFAFALCQLDPVRRRWSPAWRGGTLLAAGAAHAVLAKSLATAPPPGTDFTGADLLSGAQLMYYGGDLAEAALAAVIALQWYQATGRARARRHRHAALAREPSPARAAP